MSWWRRKRVLVTGGAGFIGSFVTERLVAAGARVTVADRFSPAGRRNLAAVWKDVRRLKADLLDPAGCRKACRGQEVVLNLAAKVAGVGYNSNHHATMFRDNMALGLNMLEAARLEGVGRFLVVSSACVYPREAVVPTPEDEGFRGRPERTNEGYGWAKRMAEYAGRAYHDEFGMQIAIARPYNAYGPRDHFDPRISHVIAALVKRVCDGESPLVVWGTGRPTRAFLYVGDFARGLIEVAEKYPAADPVNLGTDEEVSIADLARRILRLAGSKAKLRFDPSKPAGQPRRSCDTRKARRLVGFRSAVPLDEGLRRTIAWYRAHEA
ncbi:MAG: NAD-dependent epimerase/dehydratase family protein [Elusimicrobiota bacterium]|nr:NAD-dependent epimerase/dehydratase family protein [Elusimicrobiota bacterium]